MMSDALILAIDQGTYSTRAIIFDSRGRAVSMARESVALSRHSRTGVEQSPEEILRSMETVVDAVLHDPEVDPDRITTAGLATQRSSVLAWDRISGKPLSPVLSWQDRRVEGGLSALAEYDADIRQRTGLHLSPHYGASKLHWLLENVSAVNAALQAGTLVLGPLASFLLHHLTDNAHEAVDDANASRTLLWNLQTRAWDSSLLELFSIPPQVLPDCYPIIADYGTTCNGGIPVKAVNGDQTAALYAQGKPPENTIVVNIGTGAFALLPVSDPHSRPEGLLAGISQSSAQSANFYVEGTVNGAAAALEWAARQFEVTAIEEHLPGWLEEVTDPGLFINTVGGLGAPWWRAGPAPHFPDKDISAPEAMVAVIESIVFLIQANVALMCKLKPAVRTIRISGGLSRLDGLCQKLADLSGLAVHRPVQVEATARGIAWQAAGCPEDWPAMGAGETFASNSAPALRDRYLRFLEVLESDNNR
jgi:glycerol kinase